MVKSFVKWKIKKEDYNNILQDENGNYIDNPLVSEYSDVAKWCNENQQYTIADDGEYYKVVKIPEPTEEELAQQVRNTRDEYLKDTDKYMTEDYPISEEVKIQYKEYRQYLRDIPETDGFPHIEVLTYDEWCANK